MAARDCREQHEPDDPTSQSSSAPEHLPISASINAPVAHGLHWPASHAREVARIWILEGSWLRKL
jgi:hypothetical protein